MLHLQGGGDQLGDPGEAEQTEDLDEAEELNPADAAGGRPDIPDWHPAQLSHNVIKTQLKAAKAPY